MTFQCDRLKTTAKKGPFFLHTGHSTWPLTHHEHFHHVAQLIVNCHHNDEGEKSDDVDEASNQSCDVGVVKEGTDEVAHGNNREAVVRKIQEQNEPICFRKNIAKLEYNDEDDDGNQ